MDAGANEPARQSLHGLVIPVPARRPASGQGEVRRRIGVLRSLRMLLLACIPATLVLAVAGGLWRAGVGMPGLGLAAHAAASHGALMASVFFGTVIGLERAVALRGATAWSVPVSALAAGAAMLSGWAWLAGMLLVAAGCASVAVHARLLARERLAHVALLGVAAAAWLAGNLVFSVSSGHPATLAFWFSFLVLTVTAERLEMTRLTRRRPGAMSTLALLVALLLASAAATLLAPGAGVAFGAALTALACWLLRHDIARRTVRAAGLPRYMAVCLLSGHAWLALGGIAWALWSAGLPTRDAALHALGLGFLFSMVLGHAPVILPAVARVKVAFGPVFYLPWAVLHAGLAWRLGVSPFIPDARLEGAIANAAAIGIFVGVLGLANARWRREHPN